MAVGGSSLERKEMKYAIYAMRPSTCGKVQYRTFWRQSVFDDKDAAEAMLAKATQNWKEHQVVLKTFGDDETIPHSYEG